MDTAWVGGGEGGTHWAARKKGAALQPCVEMESTTPSSAACSPAPAAVMGGFGVGAWAGAFCVRVCVCVCGRGCVLELLESK